MKGDNSCESRNRGSGIYSEFDKSFNTTFRSVQYSRTAGTAAEISASQMVTADQVSSITGEIRAVRWYLTVPVAAEAGFSFNIDGAVIGQDTAPGATVYLSSRHWQNGSSKYTEPSIMFQLKCLPNCHLQVLISGM